jgi:hypothetical protein
VSLIRVVRTAAATLTKVFYVDETATDVSGSVAVVVTRVADGSSVSSGTATRTTTGTYTYVLPSQANLDWLDIAWTGSIGGGTVTLTDRVEIVGGFLFGLVQARSSDPSLSSTSTYPTADILARRIEVEQECEKICRQAFVPRYHREKLSGYDGDRIATRWPLLRKLRSVTVSGTAWSVDAVAAVAVSEAGMLTLPAGSLWPAGAQNICVEYEHGMDQPPGRVPAAAMRHLRYLLNEPRNGIPDRVATYSNEAGSLHATVMAVADDEHTGYQEVDAVYHRYQRRRRAVVA